MVDKDEDKQKGKENETNTDDSAMLVEKALKSFCCYLYVGKGHPYYKARPWNDDDSYSIAERLQTLDILVANKKTELVPIDKIKLAMDSKLIRRPETLMFALAMCARQKKSEKLRAAAYYFLAEHCKEWNYFVLFIKYASMLCKMEEPTDIDGTKKRIGWGHGWKNAVNKWYFTQDPIKLGELVTCRKGNYGWTHKDILKLSHPDASVLEVQKRAILCYVIRGFKQAEKEYGSDLEAKKILDYIRSLEFFMKCDDPELFVAQTCPSTIRTIDQVHQKALKSKKVWNIFLERMDVRTILKNLPKMNDLGFLTNVSPTTRLVVRELTNENNLRWNNILPAEILSVLNRYQREFPLMTDAEFELTMQELMARWSAHSIRACSSPNFNRDRVKTSNKSKKKTKSKISEQPIKRPAPRSVKIPDKTILDALRTALGVAQTVDITGSSKRTYLVSVRLPGRRKRICADVGLGIALPFLHRDNLPDFAVTIVGYEPTMLSGSLANITKDMSFPKVLQLLSKAKREELVYMPLGPLGWAYKQKIKYDVFINVTNEPPPKMLFDVMIEYRKLMDLPDARLINVIVNPTYLNLKDDTCHDALTINGSDPHVPWIIEAYVRGLF